MKMFESTRRHLDDILWEYGRKVEAYMARREQLKSMVHPGNGAPRVQGGGENYEGDRYIDLLMNDRQLEGLYRYISPVQEAVSKLTYHQRKIIELRYVFGMEQADVMKEMGITLTAYYREKRRAMNAIGWKLFGQYA